ncbi:DUF2306 domain-containing protein [Deinococcus planocerae]|uniref:DUF2306 domain-containing protein n=1 Tax=Deinococcus planocerae TaxID=1737569 RepID=UPI000C7F0DAD|nr:DUF2306 domain-containing protein [Deinococcus planocerae]
MNTLLWIVTVILSLLVIVLSAPYLTLNPEVYLDVQRRVYELHTVGIVLHIVGGRVALALGPIGFLPTLRLKRPRWHRAVGRVYLLAVLLGGVAGLSMAMFAYMGVITGLGFALLACLWLYTGARAWLSLRRGNVQAHRRWMIRNYALTLGAVSLRVQLLILSPWLDFDSSYVVVTWSSWPVTLALAEGYLRRSALNAAVMGKGGGERA